MANYMSISIVDGLKLTVLYSTNGPVVVGFLEGVKSESFKNFIVLKLLRVLNQSVR